MNRLLAVLIFVAWSGCPLLHSPTNANNDSTGPQSSRETVSKPQLRLTTQVVKSEYYCRDSLRLQLRLTFTNTGRVPIILSKRSLNVASYTVSRNLERAATRQYERQGRYEDFGESAIFDPPDEKDFVIIPLGGSYEMPSNRTSVHLDTASDNTALENALPVGDYVLEVVVGTWLYIGLNEKGRPLSRDSEFREKWKSRGYLWTDALTSIPMPFKVEKKETAKCGN
jgi:hypothetical protein